MKSSGNASNRNKVVSNPNTQQFLSSISRGRQSSYDRTKAAVKSNLPANTNVAFNSTTDYLRNLLYASAQQPRRAVSASNLRTTSSSNSVHTRQPEDMQEELMHLKKNILAYKNENIVLKTKLTKLENDSMKKHKEIEELLDPNQRMINVNDKSSKITSNSMKQKLLRLEQTLKDKESILQKLKSDLKTTRIEEMRMQMETMYQEIMRLQHTLPDPESLSLPRELQTRLKSMNDTILRLNENNEKLQNENKLLKAKNKGNKNKDDDSDSADEKDDEKSNYKTMSKDELIKVVGRFEKKMLSLKSNNHYDGKLTVSEEKLKDLLEERDKLKETVKKLKEEKQKYKQQADEKQREIIQLKHDIEKFEPLNNHKSVKEKSILSVRRSSTGRISSDSSPEVQKKLKNSTPDSSPEFQKKSKTDRTKSVDKNRTKVGLKSDSKKSSTNVAGRRKSFSKTAVSKYSPRMQKKLDNFKKNRAAKTIQRQWRQYQDDKHDDDDPISVINSAANAHRRRKQALHKNADRSDSDENLHSGRGGHVTKNSDSGIDDAISVIGAAARGHLSRKQNAAAKLQHTDSARSKSGKSTTVQRKKSTVVSDSDNDDFFSK